MSRATQIEFKRLVEIYYQRHQSTLNLDRLIFEESGFVSCAKMFGGEGTVEIFCGPPEYHAEIFITTLKDSKRWNLADLMIEETLKHWLVGYSAKASCLGKNELEADIEWVFLILIEGLIGTTRFKWLVL